MGDSSEAIPQLNPQKTRKPSRSRRQRRANSHQNGFANGQGSHSDTNGTPPRQRSLERARPISVSAQPATETPVKAAYAGPTFHASPAASALPVPRFISKSMPANAEQAGLQARLNEESDQSEVPASSSGSTPKPVLLDPAQDREPTPIDFLLNADREEKARAGSEVGSSQTPDRDSFLQKVKSEPAKHNHSSQNVKEQPMHHSRSPSNRDIFPMELDGTQTESPYSTLKSTSVRPGSLSTGSNVDLSNPFQHDNEAAAQSLKDLLGVPNTVQSPSTSMSNPFYSHDSSSPQLHRNHSSTSSVPLPGFSTPPATPPETNRRVSPSLHYGNRNLSPLFQAARITPQHRPSSGLRQEVAQEPPPAPAELPATDGVASPSCGPRGQPFSSAPLNSKLDARALSRAYLDAQIQAANSTIPPIALPVQSRNAKQTSANAVPFTSLGRESSPFNSPSPASPSGVSTSAASEMTPSHTVAREFPTPTRPNTSDVKSMENDLRKILNLHTSRRTG